MSCFDEPGVPYSIKEQKMLRFLKQKFETLGPTAISIMEQMCKTKSSTSSLAPATRTETKGKMERKEEKKKEKKENARPLTATTLLSQVEPLPSLRAIYRFLDLEKQQSRPYWKLIKLANTSEAVKDLRKKMGLHPDYEVFPMQVTASYKRMTWMWQKRYVDVFGRRVKTDLWNFPNSISICQAMCVAWLIEEGILQRMRLLNLLSSSESITPFSPDSQQSSASVSLMPPSSIVGSKRLAPKDNNHDDGGLMSEQTRLPAPKRQKISKEHHKPKKTGDQREIEAHEIVCFHFPALVALPPDYPSNGIPIMTRSPETVVSWALETVRRQFYRYIPDPTCAEIPMPVPAISQFPWMMPRFIFPSTAVSSVAASSKVTSSNNNNNEGSLTTNECRATVTPTVGPILFAVKKKTTSHTEEKPLLMEPQEVVAFRFVSFRGSDLLTHHPAFFDVNLQLPKYLVEPNWTSPYLLKENAQRAEWCPQRTAKTKTAKKAPMAAVRQRKDRKPPKSQLSELRETKEATRAAKRKQPKHSKIEKEVICKSDDNPTKHREIHVAREEPISMQFVPQPQFVGTEEDDPMMQQEPLGVCDFAPMDDASHSVDVELAL